MDEKTMEQLGQGETAGILNGDAEVQSVETATEVKKAAGEAAASESSEGKALAASVSAEEAGTQEREDDLKEKSEEKAEEKVKDNSEVKAQEKSENNSQDKPKENSESKAENKLDDKSEENSAGKFKDNSEDKSQEKPQDKPEGKAKNNSENKAKEKSKDKSESKVKNKPDDKSKDNPEDKTAGSRKKSHRWLIGIAGGLVLLLISAYSGVALYYRAHFLPNTVINGVDCSGLGAAAAAAVLDGKISDYSLEVTGRDYTTGAAGASVGVISAADIQLAFVGNLDAVSNLLSQQNPWLWVKALFPHEYAHTLTQGVSYDEALLAGVIKSWTALQSANMKKAQDAYISDYSEEQKGYSVVPETAGTELDVDQVIQTVSEAVETQAAGLDLEAKQLYKTAKVQQNDSGLTEAVETANRWLSTEISYDWNGALVLLNDDVLRDWVSIQDGKAVLDEEAVADFVKEQARQYDTYGKYKKFVTALGVELTLHSVNYGWRTDTESETAELIGLIKEGESAHREPVYLNTGSQKGENDIGGSYVEADLTNQHLYVYEDGEIVLETDFVSGNMSNGNRTPQGIFGLSYKTKNAVLRGSTYETPVNYWMPFYGNYGMHDATWRKGFGGTIYLTSGSHGCINLPLNAAKEIYEYVYTGSPVICYYYPEPVAPQPDPGTEGIPTGTVPEETPAEALPGETPAEPVSEPEAGI